MGRSDVENVTQLTHKSGVGKYLCQNIEQASLLLINICRSPIICGLVEVIFEPSDGGDMSSN